MDKPYYPHKPISSIDTLARTLGINPKRLLAIANKSEESYSEYTLPKTSRIVFEPKYELKKIQKRINARIFEHVLFPTYLQGGIKAEDKRDYVANAKFHTSCTTLISLDIKKFYTNIKTEKAFNIYKLFFNFPDDVSEILTKLTTYRGCVPQGGCTSSYLANLVFSNSEYRLVSSFRGQGIKYSRLLDDVTLSTSENIENEKVSEIIKSVASMFKKYDLKLNGKKTKIEYRGKADKGFQVTGLWVEHKTPKLRKKERRYIRQLVFNCEQQYLSEKTTNDYHSLWNKTSGKVALLTRLEHSQSVQLRERLRKVLPEYDNYEAQKIKILVGKALKTPSLQHKNLGPIKNYNKLIFKLGILKRSHKKSARDLTKLLKSHYKNVPIKKEFWLG